MKHFVRMFMIPALALASTQVSANDLGAVKEVAKETAKEAATTKANEAVKGTALEGAPTKANDVVKTPTTEGAMKAVKEKVAGYKTITAEELQTLIKETKDLVIIDSRGGKWFDGEVIAGAKNLPADKTNAKSLAKLIKTKTTPVVFYCSSTECLASAAAAHAAQKAGYKNLYKFPGGIAEWKEKGLPTAKLK